MMIAGELQLLDKGRFKILRERGDGSAGLEWWKDDDVLDDWSDTVRDLVEGRFLWP